MRTKVLPVRAALQDTMCKLLLVDDDDLIVNTVRTLLKRKLHHVIIETASDGEEALKLLATQTFDYVISDVEMPRMNGKAFFRAVQQRFPAMVERFAFHTSRGDAVADLGRPIIEKCRVSGIMAAISAVPV